MSVNLTEAERPGRFRISGTPRVMPGGLYGLRCSSLIVSLLMGEGGVNGWLARVDQALSGLLPDASANPGTIPPVCVFPEGELCVRRLFFWMGRLQKAAMVPLFEEGKIISVDAARRSLLVAIPTPLHASQLTGRGLAWLIILFNKAFSGEDAGAHLQKLPEVLKLLSGSVPRCTNTPRFLKAAFAMGLPCREVAGEVYQFGYGSRARWLDSTFSDKTSQIAARMARNKLLTAEVLRGAGIPVPEHILVPDIGMALKGADDLGFPVVVKPADLDGGAAVFAGLTSPDEVRRAFPAARQKSKNILVEKHFEGRDYRLTVFQGDLVWAIERIPGGVTGDGSSTVATLIERLNGDPRRGEGPHAPLKRIIQDEEVSLLLSRAGMDLKSVPGKGEFVRLRRVANVACGGMPCAVFEQVHPDNARLAVRAASALRLDLAGVDLLIPDISRSWRETGAVVCETIAGRLGEAGFRTGRGDREGVTIGGHRITAGIPDSYTSGIILTGDNNVDAVVLGVSDTGILRTGLPFERYDILVFAGSHIAVTGAEQQIPLERLLHDFYRALSPCCDGRVIVVAESGLDTPGKFGALPLEVTNEPVAKSLAVETIVAALIHADRRHRSGESLRE